MLPSSLRNHLGDNKTTPSRVYNERLIAYFASVSDPDSNEIRGERIGNCLLPTTISVNDIRKLQRELVPRSSDVFVVSYPKSGTTWTQQIVKLIWNNGEEDGRDVDEALPWIDPMTPAEAEVDLLYRK